MNLIYHKLLLLPVVQQHLGGRGVHSCLGSPDIRQVRVETESAEAHRGVLLDLVEASQLRSLTSVIHC